jgi:hypothetical protein
VLSTATRRRNDRFDCKACDRPVVESVDSSELCDTTCQIRVGVYILQPARAWNVRAGSSIARLRLALQVGTLTFALLGDLAWPYDHLFRS